MQFTRLDLHGNDLQKLNDFYAQVLGFDCVLSKDKLTVKAGNTDLHFLAGTSNCYYHFAFNIAANKIHACLKWLSLRSEVLPHEGNSIIHFANWNADAIYTLDPGGNIVEFIARKGVPDSDTVGFDPKQDVLNVSEIGCPVQSIPDFKKAIAEANVPIYSGGDEYFCAMGNIEGLFIVVDGGKKTWLPTEIEAKPFPFEATFREGNALHVIQFGQDVQVSSR